MWCRMRIGPLAEQVRPDPMPRLADDQLRFALSVGLGGFFQAVSFAHRPCRVASMMVVDGFRDELADRGRVSRAVSALFRRTLGQNELCLGHDGRPATVQVFGAEVAHFRALAQKLFVRTRVSRLVGT